MSIREILDKVSEKGLTRESVAACENLEYMKYTILHQRAIKDLEKELGVDDVLEALKQGVVYLEALVNVI